MTIPLGFFVDNGTLAFTSSSTKDNSKDFVLRINKNISYG
jgi:hypothetical protein